MGEDFEFNLLHSTSFPRFINKRESCSLRRHLTFCKANILGGFKLSIPLDKGDFLLVYEVVYTGMKASYTKSSFHGSNLLSHAHGWTLRWLKGGFSFDGGRRVFSFGDSGAAVRTRPVSKQLANQTLLVALPSGGGKYFQTHHWGMHCLTEHFLSPEKKRRSEILTQKQV